ncbi:MAG: VWA domain-containing protein [Lachnospiraceae bacterium]|jgi:hypothetical protein|nr:VWA domain-containing protein [Lachnospiraceae bacterium]
MGKRGRCLRFAALLAAFCIGAMPVQGAEEKPAFVLDGQEKRLEQVYANMPEIFVCGSGISEESIREAYLSQEKLELKHTGSFGESGEGIGYYVLLDISGSIPNSYFKTIKEGILKLQEELGEKDRLVLCTFGEEVILAADGSQTTEDIKAALEGIRNKDQKTLLFEGIDQVAALAEQSRESLRRRVVVVISDGKDISIGKKMAQEAQNTLREKGIPVYAFCIKNTATENINNFGEFARTSGGQIRTFGPEEGSRILSDLAGSLAEDLWMEFYADSNVVSNQEDVFSLKLEDGTVLSRPVMNNHWIPDEKPPRLLNIQVSGKQQLLLLFDEPLQGAETGANYQLTLDGHPVAVTGISCEGKEKMSVTLSLAETIKNGTYELHTTNIVDYSMEKNPLANPIRLTVTDIVEEPDPEKPEPVDRQEDYTGVLFLIFAAVVGLIVFLVVKSRKTSPDGGESPSPEASGTGISMKEEGGFQQHITVPFTAKKRLEVWLSKSGMKVQKTAWELGSSLIVGRSSICDVQVEDLELSRQHFCLEQKDGIVYISDLNSTNGTSVNGIRVHEKRRLEPGSVIEAGSMKITIRW